MAINSAYFMISRCKRKWDKYPLFYSSDCWLEDAITPSVTSGKQNRAF